MNFYVYENWTAEDKAIIHRDSCGHCNYGRGCHANPLSDKNGKWHGPFESFEGAEKAAKATGRDCRKHYCV